MVYCKRSSQVNTHFIHIAISSSFLCKRVLTAYTASSAAALVVDNTGVKYDNLNAILSSPSANLCIENAIADMFMKINTGFNVSFC